MEEFRKNIKKKKMNGDRCEHKEEDAMMWDTGRKLEIDFFFVTCN